MKKILVGIDFLESSINALKHAISIGNKANCDVLMIWVHRPEYSKEVFLFEPEKLPDIIKEKFQELIDKYQPALKNNKLEYKICEGKVYKELCKEAEVENADMIIVGTHGSSGFEEFWIGSNAYRIVSHAPCPVITVRTQYEFDSDIKNIVIPIDSTLETRQKLPFTTKLAKYFGAEINIVSLYSTTIKAVRNRVDNYSKQVAKYLDEENVNYTLEAIEAENITNSTIEYARKMDAELIAIMTEQETTTANLFLGAYAQQMVNHSPIPVLSVHAKEYIKIQSR